MAIELLVTTKRIRAHPALMVSLGMISVTIAILLSWKIFPGTSSIVMIAFTIIPLVPIMMKLFEAEELQLTKEHDDPKHPYFGKIVRRFNRGIVLKAYGFLLIGMILAFMMWMFIVPDDTREHLFFQQHEALYDHIGPVGFAIFQTPTTLPDSCDREIIQQFATDNFDGCLVADFKKDGHPDYIFLEDDTMTFIVETKKYYENPQTYKPTSYNIYLFNHIVDNNLRILAFVLLTSFIYGAGAIFLLSWNASIIAYFFYELLAGGFAWVQVITTLLHGIPEILGFLLISLVGGLMSVAFVRHKFLDDKFKHVLVDAFVLFLVAIVLIIISALIEVL